MGLAIQALRVELDTVRLQQAAQGAEAREAHRELREDIRHALGAARHAQESIPDVVEATGEHALATLRAEVLKQRSDSQSAQLRRIDDRRWQVTMAVLGAIIVAAVSALVGRLTK